MVAHANSFCDVAAATTTRSLPAPFAAVAARLSTRNAKTERGKKARTGRRRCVEVIGRKMEALRRLVPTGGDGEQRSYETEDGGVEELLFRAADYIVRLQVQVKAMQFMVDVLEEHTKDS